MQHTLAHRPTGLCSLEQVLEHRAAIAPGNRRRSERGIGRSLGESKGRLSGKFQKPGRFLGPYYHQYPKYLRPLLGLNIQSTSKTRS